MGNLKTDLINELIMRKNYLEQDLVRYGEVPNSVSYKEVVEGMLYVLREIAIVDTQMNYIDKYFKQPEQPKVSTNDGSSVVGQPMSNNNEQ